MDHSVFVLTFRKPPRFHHQSGEEFVPPSPELTVVMDKSEYTTKLQGLLKVEFAYKLSKIGEFKKHANSVKKAIDKLRKAGALKRQEALAAKATDAAMERFYGPPKVRKPGVPLHSIVSLRGIPIFRLSKCLYQRFRFLNDDSEWTVKLAEQFLRSIGHLEIEPDEMMVPFIHLHSNRPCN
ncbi:hypothetical protein SprV_0401465800 [Sparganum proliferum]